MPGASYTKLEIAAQQLETSLRLFEAGDNLFAVITLAGAAEEILGQLLKERGGTNSLDSLKEAPVGIYRVLYEEDATAKEFVTRANRAKNALKHHNAGESPVITFDAHDEAIDMLDRAISNYWLLEEDLSPLMKSFLDRQRNAGSVD